MVFLRLLLATFFVLAIAPSAFTQAATLFADTVEIQGNNKIVASGNVEIIVDGTRLQASKITYDAASDTLIIEGPIVLMQQEGTLFLATSAELSGDLKNGIMRGARLVLAQQLQLAASQISRVDGRYTQLDNTVASSCQICKDNPVPLWQIRASKIIHDTQERQLYFENAQLLIGNTPVFYLPRLRLPDPTLKRANGFLIPQLLTSTRLGVGIKIPYFIALGDHADLTVTPYLSPITTTLEGRYRQAFPRG
ncbi:MAG: LPS-assembly protein LptD, partial [Paracoccaceae bacterium]